MRNLIFPLFILWCATLPAKADATLTMRVQAGALDTSVSILLTDAEGTRALQYARRAYPTVVVPPALTGDQCIAPHLRVPPVDFNPETSQIDPDPSWARPAGCDPTSRPTTNREAVEALMRDLLRSIPNNIVSGERRDAARTAEDGVAPITPR